MSTGDPATYATILRHGNYDYVNKATVWDPGISRRDLPSSMYLQSKPAFMGANPWPWVDPLTGTTYTLPAKARFKILHGLP